MVEDVKAARIAMEDIKGSELAYWQARLKYIKELITEEVEVVELHNSFIKTRDDGQLPLFVPKRDALTGAHFDWETGIVTILPVEDRSKIYGEYKFPF